MKYQQQYLGPIKIVCRWQ